MPNCRGTLYQDDGHAFAYQKEKFLCATCACQIEPGKPARRDWTVAISE